MFGNMSSGNNYNWRGSGEGQQWFNQNQFDLDIAKLTELGFSQEEIAILQTAFMYNGNVTVQKLTNQFGMDYEMARKIKYMYDICCGKISINSPEDLCKHLKKMFGKHNRIGIQDLAVSQVNDIPRRIYVAGIEDETFSYLNSKGKNVLYFVDSISSTRVHIVTNKRPILKYKQSKKVEGVAEILEERNDGSIVIAIDKKYCQLLNRFMVLASFRRPEFHHGLYEIICIEGTKLYVYAQTLKATDSIKYRSGTQRIYDYGYLPKTLGNKLDRSAYNVYRQVCGVYHSIEKGNADYIARMSDEELTLEEELDAKIEV